MTTWVPDVQWPVFSAGFPRGKLIPPKNPTFCQILCHEQRTLNGQRQRIQQQAVNLQQKWDTFSLIDENQKNCTLKDHSSTWFICKKCYIWALMTKYVLGLCFPNTPDHLYVCAGWVFVGARDIYLQITKARGPPSRLDLHRAHSLWTGGESWQTQQLWFMETITPWDLWHASRCGASWGGCLW